LADINQCIKIILSTPRGSDPHRPSFASNLHDYVDYPQTAVKQFLIKETYEALLRWEPRINIEKVEIIFNETDLGTIEIRVIWTVKESTLQQITVVVL